MATKEVDEETLAAFQRNSQFLDAALKNPKTRELILRANKAINPDAVIPELDATDKVMGVVKELKDELAAERKAREDEKAKEQEDRRNAAAAAKVADGQKFLRGKGYQDDGIKKIEDLMVAEGIVSYAAGLAYFEKLNPPPAPSDMSRTSRFGDLSGNDDIEGDDFKELWDSKGQSENWFQKSLANVRKEFAH